MTPLRVLLVDDEPLARERVRALLHGDAGIVLVAECGTGDDAIAAIREHAPDLVLLDLEMPGGNGLGVARAFAPERRPALVFVTAHEKFAVEAFALEAVDYLLKPFDRERFALALRRAREFLALRHQAAPPAPAVAPAREGTAAAPPASSPERLIVRFEGRLVFLKPDEILWIEAANNHVVFHLADRQLTLRDTLSALEARLGSARFARVNRSALVHLDAIRELQPSLRGDYTVLLRDGTKLPLSRCLGGQLERLVTPTR